MAGAGRGCLPHRLGRSVESGLYHPEMAANPATVEPAIAPGSARECGGAPRAAALCPAHAAFLAAPSLRVGRQMRPVETGWAGRG